MDRLLWHTSNIQQTALVSVPGVCLYDGEEKVRCFKTTEGMNVTAALNHHRNVVELNDCSEGCLEVNLADASEMPKLATVRYCAKIILHLAPSPAVNEGQGPVARSSESFIKLSFREGGEEKFFDALDNSLKTKAWLQPVAQLPGRKTRAGIVDIERRMQETHSKTSHNIHQAFEDLTKLMDMAKDMVALSKSISRKIQSKQGEVTEDETVQFKSYLLSLGIEDPVTRDSVGTSDQYYVKLANELARILKQPIQDAGGMMTLTDAYCRVNRARGLELLSPNDLLQACSILNVLDLPIKSHQFESGVRVLMSASESLDETVARTEEAVISQGSLTPEELAQYLGIPVLLAKQRCFLAEEQGRLCRDENVEGLRFYPNLFITRVDE